MRLLASRRESRDTPQVFAEFRHTLPHFEPLNARFSHSLLVIREFSRKVSSFPFRFRFPE
jgi:hypothetical protein